MLIGDLHAWRRPSAASQHEQNFAEAYKRNRRAVWYTPLAHDSHICISPFADLSSWPREAQPFMLPSRPVTGFTTSNEQARERLRHALSQCLMDQRGCSLFGLPTSVWKPDPAEPPTQIRHMVKLASTKDDAGCEIHDFLNPDAICMCYRTYTAKTHNAKAHD